MTRRTRNIGLAAMSAALVVGLVACGSGSESGSDTVTVEGDVAIAYVMRPSSVNMNPTNGAPSAAGGDLFVRERSSASAREHNLTARFTQGEGDASDPEVSYDGKKIVFAMRCPTTNTATVDGQPACTGRWNIWEYDMTAGGLTGGSFRRLTQSTQDDDVDPAYLPAGRGFVFSSNRQTKSRINQALGRTYYALDEYERERVFNLHTMKADGTDIQQITFNQSHDRNPVVRQNGDILFSRWEHLGDRNRFAIFRTKPDGTDMFVFYGAHSPGNSFLHPRDMDPNGRYAGYLASSLMPLSGTDEGGALMFIDAANYSEQNTPANRTVPAQGGQRQVTADELSLDRDLSLHGRVTTPYPLWDGTNRVLVAYRPCEVTRDGDVVPCATLTPAEIERLSDRERSMEDVAADSVQDNVPPNYAIYMFNPQNQTWRNVATPPRGFMYTDPIPLQARAQPHAAEPTNVDPTLAAQGLALIEVRSVYDTDGLGRMGEMMMTAADRVDGCNPVIAMTTPTEASDTRTQVPDLRRIKDPADPAYHCAPARFVRATRAIPPPSSTMGLRSAIGETEFEQQQILGYAPIEPDGSFKLQVPADIPLALAIVDNQGRAFQTHANWIQVRPGERRTCDGCHSPRRGGALNSGAIVDTMPAALRPAMSSAHLSGETMASTRTRLDPTVLRLLADMSYSDVWADTSRTGITARPSITVRYTGNANPADDLATTVPVNGVINYPEHVQPLWTRDRGANTCVNCHTDTARLDLRATIGGTGRLTSYEELMIGDPLLDANGAPVTRIREGVPMLERNAPLVNASSSSTNTAGIARKSRLAEILWGETLLAGTAATQAHPNPPAGAPDHSTLLNAAEKRLLAEWMDLGGQYYNDPFNASSGVRTITTLSLAAFEANVYPTLLNNCAGCHQAGQTTGTNFRGNRYVLTGDAEGDFNVTLTMINDTCNPAANPLLARPSTAPHPSAGTGAVLQAGSAGYNAIAAWIASGGCGNP
ncbi:hypothetical protein M8A51_10130 [Schlegelella sp. S2-27]|uniref:Cytochrome c domain-containing protein n=1 Tax=Caldimonas mangrovi TaxID=2944811 RepID=A0ABT0YN84_9BURK|nr:hypothetical protein [Caldimonas mangrovi]MCM5679889.1 hypothetical protein [Caldimonas mangrovi]